MGIQLWFNKDSLRSHLSRHYLLGILPRCNHIFYWFDWWTNQTLCVSYLPFVNLGYTWFSPSYLSWNFLLAVLPISVHVFQYIYQWIKQTLYIIYSTVLNISTSRHSSIIFERLIETLFNQTLFVSYITKMHPVYLMNSPSTNQTLCVS